MKSVWIYDFENDEIKEKFIACIAEHWFPTLDEALIHRKARIEGEIQVLQNRLYKTPVIDRLLTRLH